MQRHRRPRPPVPSAWITTRRDQRRRQALPGRIPARRPRVAHPLRRHVQDRPRGDDPQALGRRRARRAARPRPRAARAAGAALAAALRRLRGVAAQPHRRHRRHPHPAPRRARPRPRAPRSRPSALDEITVDDVVGVVAELAAAGVQARDDQEDAGTASRWCLDHYRVDPNPARDTRVRLPRERKAHVPPPLAEHVERVAETAPPPTTCCRCSSSTSPGRASTSLRPPRSATSTSTAKRSGCARPSRRTTATATSRYCPTTSSPRCSPRCRRARTATSRRRCSPTSTDARLRTAITRACKATGDPHFSPHGLRRRRGSLHYKRTGSLAEVASSSATRKRVADDHYVYALTDYREVDRRSRSPAPSPDVPSVRPRATPGASPAQETRRFAGGSETSRAHSTDPERR